MSVPGATGGPAALRVALVGFGFGGEVFHAPFIAAAAGLELAAVVTTDPERRRRARAAYPAAALLDDAGEVWSARDSFDCAVIAAPNRFHVPLAAAALDAGLPVVVDKPLAPTAAAARALVDRAAARGLPLSVFQNRRWDGDFRTVRRLLAEGALGRVHRFESRYERWRPEVGAGAWRERPEPEEGGGVLLDLGAHVVDQALVLFGRPRAVYAEVRAARAQAAVDDEAFVALHHPGGVRAHLTLSLAAARPAPRFRVLGDRGGYVKWGVDVQEEALLDGERPGGADWGREPRKRWGELGAGAEVAPVPTERGDYGAFYAAWAQAVRDGAPPPVDPREAVAALEVIEAARASAGLGKVVALGGEGDEPRPPSEP